MNPFSGLSEKGKPSPIHDYCMGARKNNQETCVWICRRYQNGWVAQDFEVSPELRINQLYHLYSWWKQWSLYSIKSVREVEIHFLGFDHRCNWANVVVLSCDLEAKRQCLQKHLDEETANGIKLGCGIYENGEFSHTEDEYDRCDNSALDFHLWSYCRSRVCHRLHLRLDHYRWLQPMVEYFWQNEMGTKGIEFLGQAGFITSYTGLAYDSFYDAANPYGKVVNAFAIIEGWQTRYLLLLVGLGVLVSSLVVSIATVASGSLEAGLAAGSYALGMATFVVAVITLLSAIL